EAQRQRAAAAGSPPRGAQPATGGGVRVVRQGREADERTAQSSSTETAAPPREIRAGDRVRMLLLNTTGTVERVSDGVAEVRTGALRFKERLQNLELLEAAPEPKRDDSRAEKLRRMSERGTEVKLRPAAESFESELNLIGRTTDEAADEVDKFLDEAYLQGSTHVRIIHGHGTGALRRAVAALLKSHPHVARFSAAPENQGGAGATVVELKQ
ncbi:MAG TPA: Smr/MutS family protein, partial [Pyrinomonadaceae bacterium]|nr:Smr/MutS family protein [Pyrinomonadaceae bacterium]